jgi:tRNA pseudouridine13 synthase
MNPHQRGLETPASATPSGTAVEVMPRDQEVLEGLVGTLTAGQLIELDRAIQKGGDARIMPVLLPAGLTREQRTNTHQVILTSLAFLSRGLNGSIANPVQQIRRIFSSRISTETDNAGIISAKPMGKSTWNSGSGRWRNRDSHGQSFASLGGEYLHFTLFKVNKDTMDAINQIARQLRVKANAFGFAGTKDRRAATVQRISIRYQRIENLKLMNEENSGFKVGDFEHHTYPITLGQHGGNEFVITLKNAFVARGIGCALPRQVELVEQAVEVALTQIVKHGFINYFGMQRFGTHTIGTHEVGIKILKGDFQAAVEDILHVDASHFMPAKQPHPKDRSTRNDDAARFQAIKAYKMHNDFAGALKLMPKRYSAEYNIINHLSQPNSAHDYCNALLTVTRGLRMLYIHAYQAFVWNHAASFRWANFGHKVMIGDLVLESIGDAQQAARSGGDERDEDQNDELYNAKARVLTAEDIASGRYTIFDVVLPTPGYDIWYPENAVGEFYKDFMSRPENGGLDPYDMRRKQKEFSLCGNYRYLVGRFIDNPAFSVQTYTDDTEQLYPTDDDYIQERKRQELTGHVGKVKAWGTFAANAQQHDVQDWAEHKRQTALSSKPDRLTVHETFNRIELDGNGKRLKVEQEKQTIVLPKSSTPAEVDQAVVAPGEATMAFTPDVKSAWDNPMTGVVHSEENGTSESLNVQGVKRTATEAGLSTSPESEVPKDMPQNKPPTPAAQSQAADSATRAGTGISVGGSHRSDSPSYDLLSDNPVPDDSRVLERAARSTPSPPRSQKSSRAQPTMDKKLPMSTTSPQADQWQKVNGITIPTFRVIGGETAGGSEVVMDGRMNSPTTESFARHVSVDDKANKVAVILKFSLRTSNYATIVLREIMAAVTAPPADPRLEPRPDSRPGSSGDRH